MFSLLLPITTVRRPLHTLESNDREDLGGRAGRKWWVDGWVELALLYG